MLRWSDKWARHSRQSFLDKWEAEDGKPHYTIVNFVKDYRGHAMAKTRKRLVNLCGWSVGSRVIVFIEWGLAILGNLKFAGLETLPHFRVVHSGGGSCEYPVENFGFSPNKADSVRREQ